MERLPDSWIQTWSGHKIDLNCIDASVISKEEIATVLSRICRFGGRTKVFYNVADHSIRVMEVVRELGGSLLDQWEAINHEGDEVILGFDPPSPLVRFIPELKAFKKKAEAAFRRRFYLPGDNMPKIVKQADIILLSTEKRDLMLPEPFPWITLPEPLSSPIVPRTMEEAQRDFISVWNELAEKLDLTSFVG